MRSPLCLARAPPNPTRPPLQAPQYTNVRYPVFWPPRAGPPGALASGSGGPEPAGGFLGTSSRGGSGGSGGGRGVAGEGFANPTGLYRRTFAVPAAWPGGGGGAGAGQRVVLVLKGASAAVEAFVNGRWVGCSKDSFLDAEFDVTAALEGGARGGGAPPGEVRRLSVESKTCPLTQGRGSQ